MKSLHQRVYTTILPIALTTMLAACGTSEEGTESGGTETDTETETDTDTGTNTTTPTTTNVTAGPTTDPTGSESESESDTENTTDDPTMDPTEDPTEDPSESESESDSDTSGGDDPVAIWATANPGGLDADTLSNLTVPLDAQVAALSVISDVLSIQSVGLNGNDGVISVDIPGGTGGLIAVEGLGANPQDAAIGLGDRFIAGPATELMAPKGVELAGGDLDGMVIVADVGAGDIKVFDYSGEGDVAPEFVVTDLGSSDAVWDVHYAAGPDVLYATGTNGDLQVYEDFAANMGDMGPDRTIVPTENDSKVSVNLHGIDLDGNTAILTDVGDPNDAADGQLFVINGIGGASGDTEVDQRVQGGMLGNPVDLEHDGGLDGEALFVAEKSNDAIIVYEPNLLTGDYEATGDTEVIKAESVAVRNNGNLLMTTNPAGRDDDAVIAVNVPALGDPNTGAVMDRIGSVLSVQSLHLQGNDGYVTFDGAQVSDGGGVFMVPGLGGMDQDGEVSAVASRIWGSNTEIVAPKGLDLADDGTIIVADLGAGDIKVYEAGMDGNLAPMFVVSDLGGGPVWDVDYDDDNDRLYASGVNGTVRVFIDFMANEGANGPDRVLTPVNEDAEPVSTNLHGIHFDGATSSLLLTDVGDPGSDDDGWIMVIPDADTADGDAEVSLLIGGDATVLGNPVDLAFDGTNVYVAEKSNSMVIRYDNVLEMSGVENIPEDAAIEVERAESVQIQY